MANVNIINKDDTDYYFEDTAGRTLIGTEQATLTAVKAYSVGDLFWYNDILYKVTDDIASGGTITINTNCVATTVSTELGDKIIEPATKSNGQVLTYDGTNDRWIANTPSYSSTLNDLTDVTITSPTTNQVLKYDNGAWINGAAPTGGHEMLPNPDSTPVPTEDDVVTIINNKMTTDGGANANVASLFGVGSWSNTMTKTVLVRGTTENSLISTKGIGTWQTTLSNPTKADEQGWGWIEIPEVHGISAYDDVSIRIKYDPTKSSTISLGGYIIDDETDMVCIKFGNTISNADTKTAIIGIEISYKRNNTRTYTTS